MNFRVGLLRGHVESGAHAAIPTITNCERETTPASSRSSASTPTTSKSTNLLTVYWTDVEFLRPTRSLTPIPWAAEDGSATHMSEHAGRMILGGCGVRTQQGRKGESMAREGDRAQATV